jgi:integrase
MARYQKGQLLLLGKNKDVYYGRFREDVELPDGRLKRIYRKVRLGTTEELPTKRMARRILDKHLEKVNSLDSRPKAHLTVRQFVAMYEEDYLPMLKPGSQDTYRSLIYNHILPFFGDTLLDEVSVQQVQRFVNQVSPQSVVSVLGAFRSIWRRALLWGKASHDLFPKKGIKLPEVLPTEREPFTDEEVNQIIEAANEPQRTLYWIVAETGVRISEALALKVEDIDFSTGRLRVRKNLNRHREIGTPKSKHGYRNPVLSPELLAHLHQRYINSSGLLFPGPKGAISYRSAIHSLHRLLARLGIPRRGFHSFRYANGTAMVELGADVKTLQTRLGHSNPTLSIQLYSRAVPSQERLLAAKLGAKFAPKLHPRESIA